MCRIQMLLTFPHWPAGLPGLWRLPPSAHIPRVFWQASVRFLSCGPGCAGNKGRLYGLPLHQGVPFPGFHVFHGHPFLAQFLDNLPHIAFLPFRNAAELNFS